MEITKTIAVDQIEVTENGIVQVRTKTAFLENGLEVSRSFHRHTIAPGQDYSQEDDKVKNICAVAHTESVVAEYQANLPKEA
jgi:hypothetical protein